MLNTAGLNNEAIQAHAYRTGSRSLGRGAADRPLYERVDPWRKVSYYEVQAEKLASECRSRDSIVQDIQNNAAIYNLHLGTEENCKNLSLSDAPWPTN